MNRILRASEIVTATVAVAVCVACGVGTSRKSTESVSQSQAKSESKEDADSRARWLNASYGSTISHVEGKGWIETDDKTGQIRWSLTETGRTTEYVELFNAERNQHWRIFGDRTEFMKNGKWEWIANGHWDSTSVGAIAASEETRQTFASSVEKPRAKSAKQKSEPLRRSWYEGGTLHTKSALEWQTASDEDKLATCADFVTRMWKNDDLATSIANNITSVDDVRPYAQELVDFLNTAFNRHADADENRKLFANQTVASHAAIGMVMMGWTKERT